MNDASDQWVLRRRSDLAEESRLGMEREAELRSQLANAERERDQARAATGVDAPSARTRWVLDVCEGAFRGRSETRP
jgi:hypothetical protein